MKAAKVWAATIPAPKGFESGGRPVPSVRAVVVAETRQAAGEALKAIGEVAVPRLSRDPDEAWVASKAPGQVFIHSPHDDPPRWLALSVRGGAGAAPDGPGAATGVDPGDLVALVGEILDRHVDTTSDYSYVLDPEVRYRGVYVAESAMTLLAPLASTGSSVLAVVSPGRGFPFMTFSVSGDGAATWPATTPDGAKPYLYLDELMAQVRLVFDSCEAAGKLRPALAGV